MTDVRTNLHRSSGAATEWLRAGPLEAMFCAGELRYVRVGETEVVRRVYVAVRDSAWGTVMPVISAARLNREPEGFRVHFEARHLSDEIDFTWTGRVVGSSTTQSGATESTIVFEMEGVAGRTFKTCRTGICLLHPLRHCTGTQCVITHSDGQVEVGRFPDLISARQPFSDIVAMSQSFPGGVELNIEFRGDTFETEDQRNWADGSFKTYCRPLSRPFPYVLERGERVSQSVKITVTGNGPNVSADRALTVTNRPIGRFPGIGLTLNQSLQAKQRELLRALGVSHVRTEVKLIEPDWRSRFLNAAREAKALGLPMEVGVHADQESEASMQELAQLAEQSAAVVCRWMVHEVRRPIPSTEVLAAARRHFPPEALGCGTVGNFAELNRHPPASDGIRIVSYSMNPQVHATDDLTLIENLESQPDTVRTARSVAPNAAVAVGPVTLHRRPDPFAAGKSGEEEPAQPDPRQRTMLGAAWTLGSIAALCRAIPDAITYFDVVGPSGVMEEGEVFPLYRVLAAVGEFAGGEVLDCEGVDPLKGAALALRKGDRLRVIVASFGEELPLHLSGLESFRMLGAAVSASDGIRPLESLTRSLFLAPFSILRIDLDSKGGAQR